MGAEASEELIVVEEGEEEAFDDPSKDPNNDLHSEVGMQVGHDPEVLVIDRAARPAGGSADASDDESESSSDQSDRSSSEEEEGEEEEEAAGGGTESEGEDWILCRVCGRWCSMQGRLRSAALCCASQTCRRAFLVRIRSSHSLLVCFPPSPPLPP